VVSFADESPSKKLGGKDPANHLYIRIGEAAQFRFDIWLRETDKAMKVDSVIPGQAFGWWSMARNLNF